MKSYPVCLSARCGRPFVATVGRDESNVPFASRYCDDCVVAVRARRVAAGYTTEGEHYAIPNKDR